MAEKYGIISAMDKWYVKSTQGKVFGPIGLDDLRQWVREGRVEPLAGISSDLKNWMLAPLKPELEMDWVVENNPGQFYGPTHRAVIDDLVASGSLSPDARFYQDDRGASAEQAQAAQSMAEQARQELAAAKEESAKLKAACDEAMARADAVASERDAAHKFAAESGRAKEAAEERASKLESELEACRAEIAQLNKRIEKLDEVHAREWKVADEVIEPEIVSDAPPPSVARAAFAQQGAQSAANPLKTPFAGANGNAAAMAHGSLGRKEVLPSFQIGKGGADGIREVVS